MTGGKNASINQCPQKNAIKAACQMPDEVVSKMEKHVQHLMTATKRSHLIFPKQVFITSIYQNFLSIPIYLIKANFLATHFLVNLVPLPQVLSNLQLLRTPNRGKTRIEKEKRV